MIVSFFGKVRLTFSFIFLLNSCLVFSQASGTALLAGQSNHIGIKVVFKASSSTAVTDSCYTTSSGSYSINLAGGLYLVNFSYPNYQQIYYNTNSPVALSNSSTLNTLTLQPGNAVFVSGNVSGNWTNNNTYYVTAALTVPFGTTLTIQPGTTIKFMGQYKFIAKGIIKAMGSSTQKILFTSYQAVPKKGDWNRIELNGSGSSFDHCIIEYANEGLWALSANFSVHNSIIRHVIYGGIDVQSGVASIQGNTIFDFGYWGIKAGPGSPPSTISCNKIHCIRVNNLPPQFAMGISTYGNLNIYDNEVYDTYWGMELRSYSEPVIHNNYIHDNTRGIYGYDHLYAPAPKVRNNTFVNNSQEACVIASNWTQTPEFVNNIVVGNGTGFTNVGPITCDHNLFYNNVNDLGNVQNLPGIGQTVSTNSNGDSIDSYFNIFQDPLFVSMQTPFLQSGSPALGAGNTSIKNDIGCDKSVFCLDLIVTGQPEHGRNEKFTLFPNPNNGTFTVGTENESHLFIYDMCGRLVKQEVVQSGYSEISIIDQPAGIYLLRIVSPENSNTGRIIKN